MKRKHAMPQDSSHKKQKTEKEVKQIPGFYFDHEKGKYFRLEKNQQLIQMNRKEEPSSSSSTTVNIPTVNTKPKTVNIFEWNLQRRRHLHSSQVSVEPSLWSSRLQKASPITESGFPAIIDRFDKLFYPSHFKNQTAPFLIYWNKYNAFLKNISFTPQHTISFPTSQRTPMFKNPPTNLNCLVAKHIKGSDMLFISTSGSANVPGSVLLQNMNPSNSISNSTPQNDVEMIYKTRDKTVWNIDVTEDGLISVAAAKVGYIIDLETKKKIRSFFDLQNGDAFVHQFLDTNTLVCGFRDGSVKLIDLRIPFHASQKDHFQHSICKMQSSVIFMKPFPFSRKGSILIGSMIGELQLYDIRYSNTLLLEFGSTASMKKDLHRTYLYGTDLSCKYVFKSCISHEQVVHVWDSNQQSKDPLTTISSTDPLHSLQWFTTVEDAHNKFVDAFPAFLMHGSTDPYPSYSTYATQMI